MSRTRKKLALSEEDLKILRTLADSQTASKRSVERAKIILLVHAGKTNSEVAEEVNVCTATVNKVVKKWATFGVMHALEDLARPGQPQKITSEAKAWVVHLACQRPEDVLAGPLAQLWTIQSLTKYVHSHCEKEGYPSLLSVSYSKIWTILNDDSIKPRQANYYLVKKDHDFSEENKVAMILYKRVEWILQVVDDEMTDNRKADDLSGKAVISCEEKPKIQAVVNIAPELPPVTRHGAMTGNYEYRRESTISLLAGIDLLSGEVTGLLRDTHKSQDFIDFLNLLDTKYESDLTLKIILDHQSVHRSKLVMDYLGTKPGRFQFTFPQVHSSWLNLVENFFGKLIKQSLNKLSVTSKEELISFISRWIEALNGDPVVYRWKWKPEDILPVFE